MQISHEVLQKIAAVLNDRCGWSLLPADFKRLRLAIEDLPAYQTDNADQFLYELRQNELLQQHLVDSLVVPETYFFRYTKSYAHLKELATRWLASNSGEVFRVASIPSATGEEPYSIVMMLHEAGIPLECIEVDAMDVSAPLIETAKQGIYHKNCLIRHPLVEQSQFFNQVSGRLQVKQCIRERVNFMVGNVKRLPSAFFVHRYPVIFCRNLLIYLSDDVRLSLFNQLKTMLKSDGQLFAGPADVNFFLQQGMETAEKSQVFLLQFPPKPVVSTPVKPKKDAVYWAGKTSKIRTQTPKQSRPFKINSPLNGNGAKASGMLAQPNKIETSESPLTLAEVRKAADANDLCKAYEMCQKLISKERSVSAFLLQGEILLAMERLDESMQAMKKALYMEPGNEQALVHLVILCRRNGKLSEATRYQQSLEGIRGQAG